MRLFGFGDSFTQGHKLEVFFPPFVKWKEYCNGELPPVWIDLLGETLNMEVVNCGLAGMGNNEIFFTICENSHRFQKGDIVIINWSFMSRFRWAALNDHATEPGFYDEHGNSQMIWRRFSANKTNGQYIKESTRDEIVTNRMFPIYFEELRSFENIINSLADSIGFDVYYWALEDDMIYNSIPKDLVIRNKRFILGEEFYEMKKIYDRPLNRIGEGFVRLIKHHGGMDLHEETNGIVSDGHFGEIGNKVLYEMFLQHIIKYKKNANVPTISGNRKLI